MSRMVISDWRESDVDSDDDETVDGLMHLLDEPAVQNKPISQSIDVDTLPKREKIPPTIILKNFSLNENGPIVYRDRTVLGAHTSVQFPSDLLNSEYIQLMFFLNYDIPLTIHSAVNAPSFMEDSMKTTNSDIKEKYPCKNHQLWIRTSDLDHGSVEFKTRSWHLSQKFGSITNVRWPKFAIVAIAYNENSSPDGKKYLTIVSKAQSPEFEVRSKEQSAVSRAARGLAEPRRRRTPETEARALKLRANQEKIMNLRSMIAFEQKKKKEARLKINFIQALTKHDPQSQGIYNLVKE